MQFLLLSGADPAETGGHFSAALLVQILLLSGIISAAVLVQFLLLSGTDSTGFGGQFSAAFWCCLGCISGAVSASF